jgi:hypothetical protein
MKAIRDDQWPCRDFRLDDSLAGLLNIVVLFGLADTGFSYKCRDLTTG